jgi:hypothetical protein
MHTILAPPFCQSHACCHSISAPALFRYQQPGRSPLQVMNIERSREALALIEVYLGLIQQRVEQIKRDKNIPPELRTAIMSVVYAANRVESLPELRALRRTFERKYGKDELKAAAGEDGAVSPASAGVAEKLILCVSPDPPVPKVWVKTGVAIAAEHNIEVDETLLYEVRLAALEVGRSNVSHLLGRFSGSTPNNISKNYMFGPAAGLPPSSHPLSVLG